MSLLLVKIGIFNASLVAVCGALGVLYQDVYYDLLSNLDDVPPPFDFLFVGIFGVIGSCLIHKRIKADKEIISQCPSSGNYELSKSQNHVVMSETARKLNGSWLTRLFCVFSK